MGEKVFVKPHVRFAVEIALTTLYNENTGHCARRIRKEETR